MGTQSIGLSLFTVCGPWGRPDMAYFKFTKAILEDKPIEVYNYGKLKRNFTYIDDVINSVVKIINSNAVPNNFDIFNMSILNR